MEMQPPGPTFADGSEQASNYYELMPGDSPRGVRDGSASPDESRGRARSRADAASRSRSASGLADSRTRAVSRSRSGSRPESRPAVLGPALELAFDQEAGPKYTAVLRKLARGGNVNVQDRKYILQALALVYRENAHSRAQVEDLLRQSSTLRAAVRQVPHGDKMTISTQVRNAWAPFIAQQ